MPIAEIPSVGESYRELIQAKDEEIENLQHQIETLRQENDKLRENNDLMREDLKHYTGKDY